MTEPFDFGFTAVTEDELDSVKLAALAASDTEDYAKELENTISELYDAMIPLLDNLKKNHDKDYIYWPNRVEKIEEFKKKLKDISKIK